MRCVRRWSAAPAAGALAASDLGAEGVEALVPEAAEAVEPGVHRLERDGVERVEPPLPVDPDVHEPAGAKVQSSEVDALGA
jgi:hypothetical protein